MGLSEIFSNVSEVRFTKVIVFVITTMLLMEPEPSWAFASKDHKFDHCPFVYRENYWYLETYEINEDLLPPGVSVEQKSVQNSVLPTFIFTNTTKTNWRIHIDYPFPTSTKRLSSIELQQAIIANQLDAVYQWEHGADLLRFAVDHSKYGSYAPLVQNHPERNPQNIHRDDNFVRPPELLEIIFFTETEFWKTPIRVSYELNPNYDSALLINGHTSLEDRLRHSKYVVIGTVVDASRPIRMGADHYWGSTLDDNYVVGAAEVKVQEWLIGNGADLIHIGPLGRGEDCLYEAYNGVTYMFFLQDLELPSNAYILADNVAWPPIQLASRFDLGEIQHQSRAIMIEREKDTQAFVFAHPILLSIISLLAILFLGLAIKRTEIHYTGYIMKWFKG